MPLNFGTSSQVQFFSSRSIKTCLYRLLCSPSPEVTQIATFAPVWHTSEAMQSRVKMNCASLALACARRCAEKLLRRQASFPSQNKRKENARKGVNSKKWKQTYKQSKQTEMGIYKPKRADLHRPALFLTVIVAYLTQ